MSGIKRFSIDRDAYQTLDLAVQALRDEFKAGSKNPDTRQALVALLALMPLFEVRPDPTWGRPWRGPTPGGDVA